MSKKISNDGIVSKCAAGGGTLGAAVGITKGGSIGVAALGTAVGMPLFVPLAVCGAVAGGAIELATISTRNREVPPKKLKVRTYQIAIFIY